MTALAVLQQLASATDPNSPSAVPGLTGGWSVAPPTDETTEGGGTKISSSLLNTSMDESIQIGSWELRLLNPNESGPGVAIPFEMFYDAAGDFQRIELSLARFELKSDPMVMTAAHLRTDPNTHLVAQRTSTGDPAPVKLHGPSLTLILSGETLDGIDARFGGARGGAAGENFPSLRFEPPHFLAGGPESDIGVVCDEITADFSSTANPLVVNEFLDPDAPDGTEVNGGAWKGFHLKELGIFIGDGSQVGTWSGMAAMRDFFIDFDGILSGTFVAELVHHVIDDPQVVITIHQEDGTETDDSDVSLPAPTDGKEYRRVRLTAQPNWAGTEPQAGLRPDWTVPDGVHVEEPLRKTSVDLGWVRVPADATGYAFTVAIADHRIGTATPPTATRTVTVAAPAVGSGSDPFSLVVEGIPQDFGDVPGTAASQRLHMGMAAGQEATITARSSDAQSATLTLTDPALSITTGSATQNFTGGQAQWTVTAAASATPGQHSVCVVTATRDSETVVRRLRATIERPLDITGPDFELISYTDWRAEIGIGLARFRGFGGVDAESIQWQLSSRAATPGLFSSAGDDALFDPASTGWTDESVDLANSGGTVRPFLHTEGRLWRLTGTVSTTTTTTPRPVLVGENRDDGVMGLDAITSFAGRATDFEIAPGPTVRFHYDCAKILPTPAECSPGVGVEPLNGQTVNQRFNEYTGDQVAGFIALYRALEEWLDSGIDEVGLFGFASAEGDTDYNADLARRRVEAVRHALVTKDPDLKTAMSSAGYSPADSVFDAVAALTYHADSRGATHSSRAPGDYRLDRRVFAIIKPAPVAPSSDVTRTEYFVTLPGAPNPNKTPEVPKPKLQEHPFRHAMFRRAYVEVELLRNELIRLQIQLKLDLEAFNENDLAPSTELNPEDGVTIFFLELVIDRDDAIGTTDYSWELAALADPNDVDGFAVITDTTTLGIIGPPAITVPAISALVGGGRVDVAGFLAALGVGAVLSTTGIVVVETLIWQGIRATLLHSSSDFSGFSVAFDYELAYQVDVEIPAIGRFATDEPTKLRFRNVGVEVARSAAGDWSAEFFYSPDDGFAIEIGDPGVFRAGDGIGRLLQVRRVAAGAGSPFWTEFEFGLAFDTGIVTLDTIRVRIAFEMDAFFTGGSVESVSFAINKIGASVDIPGALKGSGMVEINPTSVAGEIELTVEPIELRATAGFKFVSDPFDAFYGFLGVEFAPGIPIFNTGAALYGLHGLLGVNMGRTNDNALAWYQASPVGVHPVQKWQAEEGAWAIGVGAVVGTVYDTGFTWNTKGTFLFELPGPKFTLATLSKILQAKSSASDSSISATIISVIMLDFENDILLIALDFVFDKSPVLTFRIPAELYFNFNDPDDWHVRFGQWQPESKRITMRVLELWNITGYLQIEGKELRNGELDLTGVAIGTGGRVDIFWGVKGVLYLAAYFEFHIGVQFDPFMLQGVVSVGGELQVGPISLSARGTLRLITPDPFVIRGEICGCISFFFFDVCGCAEFEIGDGSAAPPPPKSPFTGIALVDRITSAVVTDSAGRPTTTGIPIDAVIHVLFNQDMIDSRPSPAVTLSDPSPRNQVSNDVYLDFELTHLSLDPPVPAMQQSWAPYSVRRSPDATSIESVASAADSTRTLRLLDWIPNSHPRALDFGGGYGETVRALVERLCRPVPEPRKGCATFDEERLGVAAMWSLEAAHIGDILVIPMLSTGFGSDVIAGATGSRRARVGPRVPVDYADRVAEEHSLQLQSGPIERRVRLRDLFDIPEPPSPPDLDIEVRPPVLAGRDRGFNRPTTRPPRFDPATRNEVLTSTASALAARIAADRSEAGDDATADGRTAMRVLDRTLASDLSPDSVAFAAATTHQPGTSGRFASLIYIHFPPLVEVEATFILPREMRHPAEAIFLDSQMQPVSGVIDLQAIAATPSTAVPAFAAHQVKKARFGNPHRDDPDPPTASWLVVNAPSEAPTKPPMDSSSYLNEICGISLGEWRRRANAEAGRQRIRLELEALTGVVGGLPAVASANLLEPNTEYSLDLTMHWGRFESETATDPEDEGDLVPDVVTFRTAASPPDDVTRYVAFTDPVDDRQPHYFEEPTKIAFLSNTIDKMFAEYGRQLVARAKSALGSHVLLQPLSTTADEFIPLDSYEEALLDALNSLDPGCSSADWERLFPRPVLTFAEPLEPNTGYTITLIPRPLGEASWPDNLDGDFANNQDVFRFDVTTSRWATFSDHVAAYRAAEVGDLMCGSATSISSFYGTLPSETRSDQQIDELNAVLFGGPLALADTPKVINLWGETAAPPGDFALPTYRSVGMLLDGPEPLSKIGAGGAALLDFDIRHVTSAGSPFSSGSDVRHKTVMGERGTRLFVLFETSPPEGFLLLRLRYRPGTPEEVVELVSIEIGTEPGTFDEGGP